MTNLLLKLFVKEKENVNDVRVRARYGTLSGIVCILCNLLLSTIKITVGLLIGSLSVMADGLNNLSDMGSGVITMVGFKMAAKPADKDHPFGHGRMEYLSAFIVSMLILLVGFELVKSSAETLIAGEKAPTYHIYIYIILGISVLIKFWLFMFNRKLAKKIDSDALGATAQDSFNDSVATMVIIAAAVISPLISNVNIDAIMGVLVGLFITYSGIASAKETVDKLLGQPPEESTVKELEETILSFSDFLGIHDLVIHNYGPGRCIASVHIEVPQDIDVVHCHEQVDLCEKTVAEKLGIELTMHTDPIDVNTEEVVEMRNKIGEAVKRVEENANVHDFRMTPVGNMQTNLIFDAVLPNDSKLSDKEFAEKIRQEVAKIDSTLACVITVDRDYIGK